MEVFFFNLLIMHKLGCFSSFCLFVCLSRCYILSLRNMWDMPLFSTIWKSYIHTHTHTRHFIYFSYNSWNHKFVELLRVIFLTPIPVCNLVLPPHSVLPGKAEELRFSNAPSPLKSTQWHHYSPSNKLTILPMSFVGSQVAHVSSLFLLILLRLTWVYSPLILTHTKMSVYLFHPWKTSFPE